MWFRGRGFRAQAGNKDEEDKEDEDLLLDELLLEDELEDCATRTQISRLAPTTTGKKISQRAD